MTRSVKSQSPVSQSKIDSPAPFEPIPSQLAPFHRAMKSAVELALAFSNSPKMKMLPLLSSLALYTKPPMSPSEGSELNPAQPITGGRSASS